MQGMYSLTASSVLRRTTAPASDMMAKAQNDRFAFAVISGQGTAQARVPAQIVTWLRDVQNFLIIGAKGAPAIYHC